MAGVACGSEQKGFKFGIADMMDRATRGELGIGFEDREAAIAQPRTLVGCGRRGSALLQALERGLFFAANDPPWVENAGKDLHFDECRHFASILATAWPDGRSVDRALLQANVSQT